MAAKDLLLGIAVGLLLVGAFVLGRRSAPKGPEIEPAEPKRDTCWLHDTLKISKPTPATTEPERVDTFWLHDTIPAAIPIEKKVYSDSNYRAVVTGYHASLDSITVYPSTMIVTHTYPVPVKDRRQWGLGVSAGYGVSKAGLSPYIGVGISWTPLRW